MIALKSLWSKCDYLFTQIVALCSTLVHLCPLLLPPASSLSLSSVHSLPTHSCYSFAVVFTVCILDD